MAGQCSDILNNHHQSCFGLKGPAAGMCKYGAQQVLPNKESHGVATTKYLITRMGMRNGEMLDWMGNYA